MPQSNAIKCSPGMALELLEATFVSQPGYYENKQQNKGGYEKAHFLLRIINTVWEFNAHYQSLKAVFPIPNRLLITSDYNSGTLKHYQRDRLFP
ncbi:MAG: hypothetical protein WCA07_08000 [Gloeobacterales cyanobacterium]